MSVVGFDLGNEKSVVAAARRRGIDVLQNEVGKRNTASYVGFNGKQRLLGDEAVASMSSNFRNTVHSFKRLLGRTMTDPDLKSELLYVTTRIKAVGGNSIGIAVDYDDKEQVFTPEQITGCMFQKMKMVGELGLEEGGGGKTRVTDCVIACPSYWTDIQRRAYISAARIAGLNVLRLMNETTAVALNYGILRPLPANEARLVMFIDVGHTTTSAALVSFVQGKLTVLGQSCSPNAAGRNFDKILMEHFAAHIKKTYKLDVMSNEKAKYKLQRECERVKKVLSANTSCPFNVEFIMNDTDVKGFITRDEFEAMSQSLLSELVAPVLELIKKHNVEGKLHSIEIVGGGTRIPMIQTAMEKVFNMPVSRTCDSDESVARGCALMCAMISPNFRVKDFDVHDISPYPIELSWGPVDGSKMDTGGDDRTNLFVENNPIPSVKMVSFKDQAQPFELVARYSNPAALPAGTNSQVAKFVVSGMPAKGEDGKPPKIKVCVKLNANGVLELSSAQALEEVPPDPATEKDGDAKMEDKAPAEPAAGDKATEESAEKMETDEKDAEEVGGKKDAKEDEGPKKKKFKRVDLRVASNVAHTLDEKQITAFYEKEVSMCAADRLIHETNDARNTLESYVLEMRSQVEGDLAPYILKKDADDFVAKCVATEEWLYGEGFDAQKSEYKKRLADLKAVGDAAEKRQYEDQNREEAVAHLKKAIGKWESAAATTDDKFAHIEPAERKKITDECRNADKWLATELSKLSSHPKHVNPTVTIADLNNREKTIEKMASTIMNKPKPAPPKPKEEPKKEKEEPAAEEAKEAGPKPEEAKETPEATPMDSTD